MFGRNKKTGAYTEQEKASRTVNRMLTLAFLLFIAYSVLGADKKNIEAEKKQIYDVQITTADGKIIKTLEIKAGGEAGFSLTNEELKALQAEAEATTSASGNKLATEKPANLVAFNVKLMQKAVEVKPASPATP